MLANCVSIMVLLNVVSLTNVASEDTLIMEIFEAGNPDLKRWFDMISSVKVGTPEEADRLLKTESYNNTNNGTEGVYTMSQAYELAMKSSECPSYMLRAECAAVYMYSTSFYRIYNPDIRNRIWEPYKVFTSLLYSALKKLSSNRPLPRNTILYRGLTKIFIIEAKGRFYFNQFTSTSLNKSVAEIYGNKTLNIFVPNVPKISANLKDLTMFKEEEVLLSPFEAFEMINKTGNAIYLRSSDVQDFISSAKSLEVSSCFQVALVLLLFSMRSYFFISFE